MITSTSSATRRVGRLLAGALLPAAIAIGTFGVGVAPAYADGPMPGTVSAAKDVSDSAPTIALDGGPTVLTNRATPTIAGTSTGVEGRSVTVLVGGQRLTGTIDPSGAWSVTPATLTEGPHAVVASVADAKGLRARSTQVLTVDTVAPVLSISGGPLMGSRTSTPTIAGRTNVPAGSSVVVSVDGVDSSVTVSSEHAWTVAWSTLAAGAHAVDVTAQDAAGNVTARHQRLVVVPVVSIDGGAARLTKDAAPVVSGTSDAPSGSAVTVSISDPAGPQTLATTVTDTGTWSVTPAALSSRPHAVLAIVQDAYGYRSSARQSLVVDTVAPAVAIDGGANAKSTSHTPTITGRVDLPAGSTLQVAVDGDAHTVSVDPTHHWSETWGELGTGSHMVVATATDTAGNVGTRQQKLRIIG